MNSSHLDFWKCFAAGAANLGRKVGSWMVLLVTMVLMVGFLGAVFFNYFTADGFFPSEITLEWAIGSTLKGAALLVGLLCILFILKCLADAIAKLGGAKLPAFNEIRFILAVNTLVICAVFVTGNIEDSQSQKNTQAVVNATPSVPPSSFALVGRKLCVDGLVFVLS